MPVEHLKRRESSEQRTNFDLQFLNQFSLHISSMKCSPSRTPAAHLRLAAHKPAFSTASRLAVHATEGFTQAVGRIPGERPQGQQLLQIHPLARHHPFLPCQLISSRWQPLRLPGHAIPPVKLTVRRCVPLPWAHAVTRRCSSSRSFGGGGRLCSAGGI